MAVKKSTWDLIIKIICAVAGVLAGALVCQNEVTQSGSPPSGRRGPKKSII